MDGDSLTLTPQRKIRLQFRGYKHTSLAFLVGVSAPSPYGGRPFRAVPAVISCLRYRHSATLVGAHLANADVVLKEGVSINVPLIVGGKVRWLSAPAKLPLPPETTLPFTLPPTITISAFTEACVPAEFHNTSPPVKEPYNTPHEPTRDHCPPVMVFTTLGPGRGGV